MQDIIDKIVRSWDDSWRLGSLEYVGAPLGECSTHLVCGGEQLMAEIGKGTWNAKVLLPCTARRDADATRGKCYWSTNVGAIGGCWSMYHRAYHTVCMSFVTWSLFVVGYGPNSTWLVTSRLDTTRHVGRVERVEPCCSNMADKMHGLDTSNMSCRDVTSHVKFGLKW